MSFMARPTQEFERYLELNYGAPRGWYRMGRIAMALEVITVIRLLEDHEELVAHAQECISVLQTLLNDQGLTDDGYAWYERLVEWRKPKLALVSPSLGPDDDALDHDAQPSEPVTEQDAPPPHEDTSAQPCSDQTTDPPSSDSPL